MTEELIARIARCLDEENIPYMIMGGQAVLIYGRARVTRDIDFTLGMDSDKYAKIVELCNSVGLRVLTQDPKTFTAETMVLPAEDPLSKMRVDLTFSFTPYERQAIERAKNIEIAGYTVRFATCEDVIIQKMVAGRAVDIEDVKSILAKQGDAVDIEYIRKWLGEFEVMEEYAGVLKRFDDLSE